jgi:hypothetical protein
LAGKKVPGKIVVGKASPDFCPMFLPLFGAVCLRNVILVVDIEKLGYLY